MSGRQEGLQQAQTLHPGADRPVRQSQFRPFHRGAFLQVPWPRRAREPYQATRMMRTSMTLVRVGPVIIRSPSGSKKLYESLRATKVSGFKPRAAEREALGIDPCPCRVGGPVSAVRTDAQEKTVRYLSGFSHQTQDEMMIPTLFSCPFKTTVVSPSLRMQAGN